MSRIRVLLVDDHTIVRQGLARLLESDREVEVVGEAGDGRTAIELAQRLHPDVIVMDLALPDLDGVEATREILQHDKDAKVLVLTMQTDDVAIRKAVKAGARGYLLKDSPDVVKAVRHVARGQPFFSPAAARFLTTRPGSSKEVEDNLYLLTEREREVLRLIADGKTNKDIAAELSVSVNTIETHRKHIMEKLDLHSTADIVRFAVRKNVVQ
jgi:two-component system, NarL family, response regulator NreC